MTMNEPVCRRRCWQIVSSHAAVDVEAAASESVHRACQWPVATNLIVPPPPPTESSGSVPPL